MNGLVSINRVDSSGAYLDPPTPQDHRTVEARAGKERLEWERCADVISGVFRLLRIV